MKVKVLFFGATADSVGERKIEMSFDENSKAEDIFKRVYKDLPNLEKNHKKDSLHFALNQRYVEGGELVNNGDEFAIFTAVSGG